MAQTRQNVVLSGKHKDYEIKKSPSENLAYVKTYSKNLYITNHNVESIIEINSSNVSSKGDAVVGAIIGGTAGAIVGAAPNATMLLEVKWKDGGSSIIKVTIPIYEAIIVGMHQKLTDSRIQEIEKTDSVRIEKSEESSKMFQIFCYVAWGLFILYSYLID